MHQSPVTTQFKNSTVHKVSRAIARWGTTISSKGDLQALTLSIFQEKIDGAKEVRCPMEEKDSRRHPPFTPRTHTSHDGVWSMVTFAGFLEEQLRSPCPPGGVLQLPRPRRIAEGAYFRYPQ